MKKTKDRKVIGFMAVISPESHSTNKSRAAEPLLAHLVARAHLQENPHLFQRGSGSPGQTTEHTDRRQTKA